MVKLNRVTRSPTVSNYSRVAPEGGILLSGLAGIAQEAYEVLAPVATDQMTRSGMEEGTRAAQELMGQPEFQYTAPPTARYSSSNGTAPVLGVNSGGIMDILDRTEGAGDYTTLFGHSQRDGGRFAGIDVTQMTLDDLANFQSVSGDYGQWVSGQVGRVATPIGRYQIVGTTLRRTAQQLGLPGNTVFTPEIQDQMFQHLANARLRSASTMSGKMEALRNEWEGFQHVSDADLSAAIRDYEAGDTASVERPRLDATMSSMNAPTEATVPETTIRNSEGRIEPRMYSPLSDPILQAHNAAAEMTFVAETTNQFTQTIMGISNETTGDPDAFQGRVQPFAGAQCHRIARIIEHRYIEVAVCLDRLPHVPCGGDIHAFQLGAFGVCEKIHASLVVRIKHAADLAVRALDATPNRCSLRLL